METLVKEKPDMLVGYASIVLEIAKKLSDEQLNKLNIKIISVNSEVNTKDERDFISKKFTTVK